MPAVNAMIRHRALLGREVDRCLEWLALRPEELCITEPRGAYDPHVGALRARGAAASGEAAEKTTTERSVEWSLA
jgi:hypothetical protein